MTTLYTATRMASFLDAVHFSYLLHKGQFRRDLAIPYWVHVSLVSATIAEWGGSPDQVEAGLGHDLVEDTLITLDGVIAVMGVDVGSIIDGLTADKDPSKSWRLRKLDYIMRYYDERVNGQCYLAKLCDMYSNLTSFMNTFLRTGECTAKADTLTSYVVLTGVCLDKLQKFGTLEQFRVARANMGAILKRVNDLGMTSVNMQPVIGDTPDGWIEYLKTEWSIDDTYFS